MAAQTTRGEVILILHGAPFIGAWGITSRTKVAIPLGGSKAFPFYAELRASYNAYRRMVRDSTRLINLMKGLLDGVFPEFTQVFKDV